MNLATNVKELRRVTRIPVDTVLFYRLEGMHQYEMCDITSVSAISLEMLTDSPLETGTIVTVAVRPHEPTENHTVVGEVGRREQVDGKWLHVVTAPNKRPWSSVFVYRVLFSTFNPSSVAIETFIYTYGSQRQALQNVIRDALRE